MDIQVSQLYKRLEELEKGMNGDFRIKCTDGKVYRSASYGAARKAAVLHEADLLKSKISENLD